MKQRDFAILREALDEMAWQFAHRGVKNGKAFLSTGGMSALETAFEALGWTDPRILLDGEYPCCDVEGCVGWVVTQGCYWTASGYWMLCDKHSVSYAKSGDPADIGQPAMKQRAIDRENSRDEHGNLP